MITTQDTLAPFAPDDRICVVDGGHFDGRRGRVLDVVVLPHSIMMRVALDEHPEVLTFAEWQLGFDFPRNKQPQLAA